MRDAIARGTYKEGEPIRQDEVAQFFTIGKIAVREALKLLEAEGLVEFRRNRGVFVTQLPEPEIEQMFEVGAILEAFLIGQSVRNKRDAARWSSLNWRSHSSLYEDAAKVLHPSAGQVGP